MKPRILILVLTCASMLALTMAATAATQAGYSIDWWTADSGGGVSSGGGYRLTGTIGQPDAAHLSAGGYSLSGGYWGSAATAMHRIFLPVLKR
jgi:hypothetical protein